MADAIGNPLQYRDGYSMSWANGRQLSSVITGSGYVGFAYNADGRRLYKTDGTNETIYLVVDGVAVGESINNGQTVILYLFDENGDIYGINVGGTDYFFRKNLQGDVVGIWDPETGDQIVTYTYDPWGKLLTVTDTTNYGLADLNPFRYRTYYYDSETGFYYLNSRYYDPEIGRFVNADGLLAGADTTNLNLFAYCGNNPVNSYDPKGEDAIWLQDEDAVLSFGHTGLLLQDKDGSWWHFYWGNNRDGSKGKKGNGKILMRYSGRLDINSINKFYYKNYGGKYESTIYLKGDFTKSVSYAKTLNNKAYNFIFNNCMQVSTDVLRQGSFAQYNSAYKAVLLIARCSTIPNLAYLSMRALDYVLNRLIATPRYSNSVFSIKQRWC